METVNSKTTPLPSYEVIFMALQQLGAANNRTTPIYAVLAEVAKETTLPSADVVQIGNTVFIGHRGKGKNKDKMVGRAFNVDTARNLLANGKLYIGYLRNKGVKAYVTAYRNGVYDPLFAAVKREEQDLGVSVYTTKKRSSTVAMVLLQPNKASEAT